MLTLSTMVMAMRSETHSSRRTVDEAFRRRYGPWAMVTGASSGIGRAMAEALAARGLGLVLVARSEDTLQDLARAFRTRHAIDTDALSADLSTAEGCQRAVGALRRLDVGLLVHAAGFGTSGPFVDHRIEDESALLTVNALAPLRLSHAIAPRLIDRGQGGIVFLSSIVAFQGVPGAANYAASKAYVQSLAEGLAAELAHHGVDVLASAPGPVHSGFAARAGMQLGRAARPEDIATATLAALGRWRTIRPGWLARLLGWSLSTAPRALRVRIMAAIMAGMTRGQPGRGGA